MFNINLMSLGNLIKSMDLNVLWGHEENCGQDAAVHFCNRDGKDWKPGQNACQGMDHCQKRVTQQQPEKSAEATLQKCIRDWFSQKILGNDSISLETLTQCVEVFRGERGGTGISTGRGEDTRSGAQSLAPARSLSSCSCGIISQFVGFTADILTKWQA